MILLWPKSPSLSCATAQSFPHAAIPECMATATHFLEDACRNRFIVKKIYLERGAVSILTPDALTALNSKRLDGK